MATVRLRPGHVQPVWAGHPWVYAQAIESVTGAPGPGDVVSVVDGRGNVLGRGYWSPKSAIPVRVLTRDPSQPLDTAWLGRRIEEAARWRREVLGLPGEATDAYRLVHAEGDHLSGLVVDVYRDVATVQLLTAGMKRREDEIFGHVARVTGARTIVEIAGGARIAQHEGFEAETRVVRGPDVEALRFREIGLEHDIEIAIAQKTGYFLDQRENRARVETMARGRRVLDAFCYVGSFGLAAARGGASHVVSLDSSAPALATAASIARKNGLGERIEHQRGDVKRALVEMAQRGEKFDLAIVDPPKLAPSARHLDAARRAYRRLNANALRLVEPGGLLVSCSCSAAMRPGDLLKTIALAARDADREVVLLHMGEQGADHPVPAAFPEGRYLKCAFLRVT